MQETARRARQDLDSKQGTLNSEVTIGITPVSSLLKPLVGSLTEFQRRHPRRQAAHSGDAPGPTAGTTAPGR
jgi:hypothetical protein